MDTKDNTYTNSLFVLLLLSIPLAILLYFDFLYFHILIEAYTIAIGVTIFVININARQYFTNSLFTILALAFLSVASIDFVHSLAYKGMNIKGLSSSNTASQLWIFARYIHALSMLGAIFYINRHVRLIPLGLLYGVITLGGVGLIVTGNFPVAYIEGQGQSVFKVLSEFIVITFYIASYLLLKRLTKLFDGYTLKMLEVGVIFAAAAEVLFSLYIDVYSVVNATGHFLKMASYYFFYRACVYMSVKKPLESIFSSINENKKFLNNIIESLSYPFYVINARDYSIKLANSATTLRADNLSTCHKATHNCPSPCSSPEHPCPMEEVKRTKEPVIVEHTHTDKEGKRRHIEVHAYPIFDSHGEVEQIIEYCFDITEKKQERELITKLSLAIEQSSNSILITDCQGVIEYVNSTFTQVTGYRAEEVIGKKPSIFKSGVTPPELYEELWRTIKSGRTWKSELCNKKKNGELFWETVTISPLKNERGEITHFVGVREDIQDRIRAEAAEERAKDNERRIIELESELQALDHLLQLHQPSITARAYGSVPMKEAMSELFDTFVKDYVEILEKYIDSQIFKVEYNTSELLRDFTDRLGILHIGARDLIEIHTAALRMRTSNSKHTKSQAYTEEGRMMLLEIMGHLVNFYRNYFIMTSKTIRG